MGTSIASVISAIGTAVSDIITAIGTAVSDVITAIGTAVSDIITAIGTAVSDIITAIGTAVSDIITAIGTAISDVITAIGEATADVITTLGELPGIIVDLFEGLFRRLFLPDSDYYSNKINSAKTALNNKIPYQTYVNNLRDIGEATGPNQTRSGGITTSIDLNNYKLTDRVSLSLAKFIDFSIFNQYRDTWFTWVRVVVYILLLIYNFNEFMKFLRGFSIANGSSNYASDNSQKGGK